MGMSSDKNIRNFFCARRRSWNRKQGPPLKSGTERLYAARRANREPALAAQHVEATG